MNVFLLGLLRGLSKRGIATAVLTRATGETVEVADPFPGVRVFHVPCGWVDPPSRESAFASLDLFVERSRILIRGERIEPGVVSAHYWMSGVAARKLAGAPMVLCFHTVEARKVPAPGPDSSRSLPSAGRGRRRWRGRRPASSASRSTTSRRTGGSFRSCRRRGWSSRRGWTTGSGSFPPAWSRGRTSDFPRKG